jgi:hypothetical protein
MRMPWNYCRNIGNCRAVGTQSFGTRSSSNPALPTIHK